MSHSFTLPLQAPPDLAAALAALPVDDVVVEEGLPQSGDWPIDTWLHLYRPEVSCRTVELGFDDEGLVVRIFTSSCVDDVLLALALVEAFAQAHGVSVHDEQGAVVAPEQIGAHYEGFAEGYAAWGAELIPQMLSHDHVKAPLTLPGPGRPFVVGPRLVAALRPDEEGFVERFYDHVRTVRWFDPDGWWHHAEPLQLQREDGFQLRLAALGPEVRYLMPDVHGFALATGPDDAPLFLPSDQLPQIVHVEWLDERQFLLEPLPAADWPEFLALATPRCQAIENLG